MDCIGKTLGNSQSYRLSSRISVVTQRTWQGASHYGCVGTFFPTLKKGLAWKQWAQERKLRAGVSRSRARSFSRLLRSLRRVINPKRLCVCGFFFFLVSNISSSLLRRKLSYIHGTTILYFSEIISGITLSVLRAAYFLLLLLFFSSRANQKR